MDERDVVQSVICPPPAVRRGAIGRRETRPHNCERRYRAYTNLRNLQKATYECQTCKGSGCTSCRLTGRLCATHAGHWNGK